MSKPCAHCGDRLASKTTTILPTLQGGTSNRFDDVAKTKMRWGEIDQTS